MESTMDRQYPNDNGLNHTKLVYTWSQSMHITAMLGDDIIMTEKRVLKVYKYKYMYTYVTGTAFP